MQCLVACKKITTAYWLSENFEWTTAAFSNELYMFFTEYVNGSGPIYATQYVVDALIAKGSFEYLKEHDPTEAIERIFNSLINAHTKQMRIMKELPEDAVVKNSETFFGKFVTSSICAYGIHFSLNLISNLQHLS